jgi:DNA-directed RNA polymerase II subunit RPB2
MEPDTYNSDTEEGGLLQPVQVVKEGSETNSVANENYAENSAAAEIQQTNELEGVSEGYSNENTNTENNAENNFTAEPIIQQLPPPPQTQIQQTIYSTKPPEPPEAYPQPMNATQARAIASNLIHQYFTTQFNALTRHHIESYDQFLQRDLPNIIRAQNPIMILKNHKAEREAGKTDWTYKAEIYIGGEDGSEIFIGTPTTVLQQGNDVHLMYPNEARLRNLTYGVQVETNVTVRITIKVPESEEFPEGIKVNTFQIPKLQLCYFPLMLHSSYCLLHGKPAALLKEMGECPQDQGGYFIIDGSEKVLITRQEGAFNTLWIKEETEQNDPNVQLYCSLQSLNPVSRDVKRVTFYWTREQIRMPQGFGAKEPIYKPSVLEVAIPFVLKPLPVFVLFRALGYQSDAEIIRLIFPDINAPETKLLADLLIPSINAASPFLDTYSAIEYIKSLTKGFSVFHVLDIIHNQLFPHVMDKPGARAHFLAECVRKILRVVKKLEVPPSRDDNRYQRLLTSGFLCQMLFQNLFKEYTKAVKAQVDEMFAYNESVYTGDNFIKIFAESNRRKIFQTEFLKSGIMAGFKGKWKTGLGKEEAGLIQELSRLSYLDFMSHLRRVVLHFDTSIKLKNPRFLDGSQYGYFCTSETPSGSHIGVTKNLSIMTAISTNVPVEGLLEWLYSRGHVIPCEYATPQLITQMLPVYINSGIVGYTAKAQLLAKVLRFFKRSGFLPPLSSSGYNILERKVFIYMDDGRCLRPLIICPEQGKLPDPEKFNRKTWRDYVVGLVRENVSIGSREFVDPLAENQVKSLEDYVTFFEKESDKLALIEYLDPFEQNEVLLASYPEHVIKQTTHMEVHPSTIMGLLGNMIPYPNHNQSPRNQLSASQSKQGLSLYATNFSNRFDNTANILCYPQEPLSRTIYQNYVGNGKMGYGQNIILAMGMYGGYNQEDGIIMNADALARGQFRSINYRSYEAFEADDELAHTKVRIGNPKNIPNWLELKSNLNYNKLDENGIITEGTFVDQNTVLVGRYMALPSGDLKDDSVTPQVWTRGRVEKVVVTVNNLGLKLVKIRITQDRIPVLGDKFSNRHGQKGTINVMYRGHDMPRTMDGIVPDMIMNPTAIPSRMTIGQILEMILGNVSAELGAIGNCTAFMNDGSPHKILGDILESLGLNRMCNQVLYNGMTGEQMTADIFMGVVYGMRLKHMTDDKWNARGTGRKEQRTHQPTGGRGNEGGLKIGEMERDAIVAHGISDFLNESMTTRSDGDSFYFCNGCGTIPLYNETTKFFLCPMCDGPIKFSGETASDLNPIPPAKRSSVSFSKVDIPYATKLLLQELSGFENVGLRVLTTRDVTRLKGLDTLSELKNINTSVVAQPLPQLKINEPDDYIPPKKQVIPLPTAYDVQKELETLQEEARQTFIDQNQIQNLATPLEAQNKIVDTTGQLVEKPTNELMSVPQGAAAIPSSQVIPVLAGPGIGQTLNTAGTEVQLAPGSIAPNVVTITNNTAIPSVQQGAPVVLPGASTEGAVVATTDAGVPIINVSTDSQAMADIGLEVPRDASAPLIPFASTRPQSSKPRVRRPVLPQQPGQQEGGEQEEQTQTHGTGAPVRVIKLG